MLFKYNKKILINTVIYSIDKSIFCNIIFDYS